MSGNGSTARWALCAAGALSALLATTQSHAQTLAPKVCVVVAGDADGAVRAFALRVEQEIAATATLRAVSDDATRARLRGEIAMPESAVQRARAELSPSLSTTAPLDVIATELGCNVELVVAAAPSGIAMRRYDAVTHALGEAVNITQYTDGTAVRVASSASATPTAVAVTTTAANPTAATTSTTTSAQPITAAVAMTPPPPPRATVATAPRATTARAATTTAPRTNPNENRGPSVWAWVAAGGVAAALIGGFFIVQAVGTATPVLHVERQP